MQTVLEHINGSTNEPEVKVFCRGLDTTFVIFLILVGDIAVFEHKQLDGEKCRIISISDELLKPEILEIRDPKNSVAVDDACRSQYGVIGEVLVERYLPPETKGDTWAHDNVASPWWSVVGHPPHGGIVADFNKYIGGAYLRTLNKDHNVVAYTEQGEEVTFDGREYLVTRKSDEQEVRGNKMSAVRQQYYS